MEKLSLYTISKESTILEAMDKIDKNNKGFLIVIDNTDVFGVITDGDIRRAIINKSDLNDTIEKYCSTDFKYIALNDDFDKVVEYFKNIDVKFLPIIEDNKLANIITKTNLHTLLLQNIAYDPLYDFCSMDDSLIEHEIYSRPWGFYKTTVLNDYFQSKILSIKPKSSISLQKHLKREEHWIIVNGKGQATLGNEIFEIKEGTHLHIPKNTIHRIKNTSSSEFLIVTEVQLGDYFGEDDIIRFEDDYGRI